MRFKRLAIFVALLASVSMSSPLLAVTESGNIHVGGTVSAPPPSTAPTIDHPPAGSTFDSKNITVSGTCIPDLIVKIYSNNIFVGSTICQADGTYSLRIDLFMERNDLVARQFDSLNQPSPDSSTVTVYYVPPEQKPQLPEPDAPEPAPPTVALFQLIIDYDYTVQGVYVDQPFRLPVQFRGGTPDYTVSVDWGDGSNNTFQRADTSRFDTSYVYTQPGRYIVTIRVTDSTGQTAYLQFVTIVHGESKPLSTTRLFGQEVEDITVIVALAGILLVIIAFITGAQIRRRVDK